MDGQVLRSEEIQGDPLAIPMHVLATIPLVDHLSDIQDVTQVWNADNSSAAGNLTFIDKWCNLIKFLGPAYGYHANNCKMWAIAREQYLSKAKKVFNDTGVMITSQGQPSFVSLSAQKSL